MRFLPKIIWCDELPEWIISSDRAAYTPHLKTIHIRKGESTFTLIHELIHWLIDILRLPKKLHIILDKGRKPL